MKGPTRPTSVRDPARARSASPRALLGGEAALRLDRPDLIAEPRRGLEFLVLDRGLHVFVEPLNLAPQGDASRIANGGLAHVLGAPVDPTEQRPELGKSPV